MVVLVYSFQEMPAKQLTEANRHPRYSCSKRLLVDAIFIWFSDRMLFTLTALKIWSMASGAAKNRMLEQKRFFSHKNDTQSVANGDRRRVEIKLRQCDIC